MDFLSKTWCNFAVQALQPPDLPDQSIVLLDNTSIKTFDSPFKMEKSVRMDESDFKSIPPWKSNDVKSWIWMQQAMHPELNYNRRKWLPWKMVPLKSVSIKKWMKEIKQKRKEEDRLERAEVHAAISVAGIAAALAAIAADNSRKDDHGSKGKEDAVASAAALVAAQCAKVAEAMGAKREQLSSVIGSAMTASTAADILTLTAATSTSLKGAATLKARKGYNFNKVSNGSASVAVLPIQDKNTLLPPPHIHFDFEKWQSILAHGTQLHIETPDGNFGVRSVSIFFNSQAKVILRTRKLNLFKSKKESIIMEVQAEYYKDSSEEEGGGDGTCYMIVLSTNRGITKLDMGDDYNQYKTWATTINHMLFLSSSSFTYHI
ncbi:VAN3-binding protein [Euphorbia lathyris]|uniref:VAN3-binding protein n=1 Tax=Euphorbia lathyris TaxID=212925 RepID=UPI0033130E8E